MWRSNVPSVKQELEMLPRGASPMKPTQTTVRTLKQLQNAIESCDRCDRLRAWCNEVATTKKRAYADWDYWGKPVPGFGDGDARLWIIGLAPGAHGANRTGRVFTGDRSGDFLFAALHRTGYANQPTSVKPGDGLVLSDCFISASARCAPPGNKPTPAEVANCSPFLDAEWRLLKRKRVILALGGIAWNAAVALSRRMGIALDPTPTFAHGATTPVGSSLMLVGSYHVSQQNTFTGRLTVKMFDDVLRKCRALSE